MFSRMLPRGIQDYQLGKSLRFFRDLYDPKLWGEYKVELNRRENIASFVLRYPQQPNLPFRLVTVECPVTDAHQWLEDATAYRLSFFYTPEVKRQLGDTGMLEQAIKRYGHAPTTLNVDAGFYKMYGWDDEKTRIELGLGQQYDRLQFLDAAQLEWRTPASQRDKKPLPFGDLF